MTFISMKVNVIILLQKQCSYVGFVLLGALSDNL